MPHVAIASPTGQSLDIGLTDVLSLDLLAHSEMIGLPIRGLALIALGQGAKRRCNTWIAAWYTMRHTRSKGQKVNQALHGSRAYAARVDVRRYRRHFSTIPTRFAA